jgi:hypothetical protein
MRAFDRLLSVLIALALLVLGLTITVEVVHTFFGQPGHLLLPWEDLARWARGSTWNDLLVRALGAALTILGLALLLTEIRRRRPGLVTLSPRVDGVTSGVTRSSLNRALAATAADVDGVRSASATLRRRRADIKAVTALRDPGDLQSRINATVSERVQHLDLVATPAVRVRLRKKTSS